METLIIHTEKDKLQQIKDFLTGLKVQFETPKTNLETESPYDPEFVTKIQKSKQEFKEGKFTRVAKEDLQSFLGL